MHMLLIEGRLLQARLVQQKAQHKGVIRPLAVISPEL
jgi:hypothetical protein